MFTFEFEKRQDVDDDKNSPPIFSGYGALTIWVNGVPIWDGIETYWDELVYYLAKSWTFIKNEDPYPFAIDSNTSPYGYLERSIRELLKRDVPEDLFYAEELKIFEFSNRHDLSNGMQDLCCVPSIYVLREGDNMRIAVGATTDIIIPVGSAMAVLEAMGSAIAEEIDSSSLRGEQILNAWDTRNRQ